jgi:transposase
MTKGSKKYDRDFKVEAVRLVLDGGRTVSNVAEGLGISDTALYRWISEYKKDQGQAFPGSGNLKPEDEEIRRMKRLIADLQEENAILKKAAAIFMNPRK